MFSPRSRTAPAGFAHIAPSPPEDFSKYTSGRWLHDREHNEALRYRHFNVNALKGHIALRTGASRVVDVYKMRDAPSSKVFRVQLSDGDREVIVRVPAPLADSVRLTTASEVATMTFLRDRLGLAQVPRVISWSSNTFDTPVGAEFIIMDVGDEIELGSVWPSLTMRHKIALVHEWVKFEGRVIHAFQGDEPDDEYVLGPSVRWQDKWQPKYGISEDLRLDLGPYVPSFVKSVTTCERTWIRKHVKRPTRNHVAPWEVPAHLKIPMEHLRLLDLYDKVAQYFIPTDERLLRPTMLHLNFNGYNIFISQEALARGDVEITAVIDWQNIIIFPLYLTAYIHRFIEDSPANDGQDKADLLEGTNHLRKAYQTLYFETDYDIAWASALLMGIVRPAPQIMPFAAHGCWHSGYADSPKEEQHTHSTGLVERRPWHGMLHCQ